MTPGLPATWDDENGSRRSGFITHYDDENGVRHDALIAIGRLDRGTVIVPPPPIQTTARYLGYYSGSLSDDAMVKSFGSYPQLTASYWQLSNTDNTLATETARAKKGISSHAVIAPKDSANYPTGARNYINGLVNGTAQYVDFFSAWLTALQKASLSQVEGTPKMIAFPMCEPEVMRQQGGLASLQNERGSTQATMERVGEYHQVMYDLMKKLCPNVLRGVWLGGSSDQYTNINYMFKMINSGVQRAGTDPYMNNLANNASPTAAWSGRVNAYRAVSGAHHAHWVRWGSPPVILTETGISHYNPGTSTYVNTDAQKATWIGKIREAMDTLDIERVVYFGSAGPRGRQTLTSDGSIGDFGPLSRAKFGQELLSPTVITPAAGISAISAPTTIGDPDTTGVLKEISGLVVSRKNVTGARLLWGANDQGAGSYIYAFRDQAGNNLKHRLEITGLTISSQVQFEEMSKCVMPDGTTQALMVGRIGDGYTHFIRVPEPTVSPTGAYGTSTAPGVEFHFVNQSYGNNHEAFFVDPITNDLFLIEKTGGTARPRTVRVWRIPNATFTATGRAAGNPIALGAPVATIKCDIQSTGSGAPTGADISDDGRSILIGNYQELMIWHREPSETVEQALRRGGSTTTPSDPHVRLLVSSGLGSEAYCFDYGANPTVGYSLGESPAGTGSLKQFSLSYA